MLGTCSSDEVFRGSTAAEIPCDDVGDVGKFTADDDDGEDANDAGDSDSDVGVDVHVNMEVADVEAGPETDDEFHDVLEPPDESEQRDGVRVSVIAGNEGS